MSSLLAGVLIGLLGVAVGLFGLAVLLNPAFYERSLKYGHPRDTPTAPFALVGIVLGVAGLALGICIATGVLTL